jgi:hypothetical protein
MEQGMRPVDVISVCSADGQIRPLRLQFKDEQNQLLRINVDEIVSTREITHVGVEAQIFRCRVRVWEKSWLLDLKYLFRSHTWQLQRIQ